MKLTVWLPAILSLAYPVLGVALSAWSFFFAEAGATPDGYAEDESEPRERILDYGSRYRARWSAAMLFRCGALMVVAGVFMNFADNRHLGLLSVPAMVSYALTVFCIVYSAKTTHDLWLDRRESAFDAFYGRDVFPYYKDRDAVSRLFFERNRMPYWSIFKRTWEHGDLATEELLTTLQR
jgi:hypothetical protein